MKISNNKLKFKDKPSVASGLQNSISMKNHYLSNFIRLKDPSKNEEIEIRHKGHRNVLSTLLKQSK